MILKTIFFLNLLARFIHRSHCQYVSKADLEASYDALQQWYDSSLGLWIPSTGWWNSANCLTVIIGLGAVDAGMKQDVADVASNTFIQAPQYSPEMIKVMGVGGMVQTYYGDHWPYPPPHYGNPPRQTFEGFLNDYYDDEGWWALAWIAAYDLYNDTRYLNQAKSIFNDMNLVFGKTNCSRNSGGVGGIWWDKNHTYVNAIPNELFLSTAASLANRAPSASERASYLSIAKQQWAWFQGTGMIVSNSTINDGLDQQNCQNNGQRVWSYNQGVILGGLVELSKATRDTSYISTAHSIAGAAIQTLAPDGILRDFCESESTSCGSDGSQFKGIFVRNLLILHKASPKNKYADLINRNAKSIWDNDRNNENELSLSWAGPYNPALPANASTQSSAMDCLVAAVAIA